MLTPLRTTKELEREGLRMKNCLADQAVNVRAGRKAYFRWQGAQPATVQFIRTSRWRLGQILGPQNKSLPFVEVEPIRRFAEALLAGEHTHGEASNDEANATIRALCSRARRAFTVEERDRVAAALRDIRGKTQRLGSDTSAYCIFGADQGFVQFMADVDCHEYLCEIQSHHYSASVGRKLTDEIVNLIAGSGFHWPCRRQNFSRWFRVRTDADIDTLTEFSLGILNEVFGHESGGALALTVHLP
jgi:hypothetical protein